MSAQTSPGRRQAALRAAAQLGPMTSETEQAIADLRADLAERRAARPPAQRAEAIVAEKAATLPIDRRRSGKDRRSGEDRRAPSNHSYPGSRDQIARADENRFADKPEQHSAFGDSLS